MNKKYQITILPGDGIGPETIKQAYKILEKIKKEFKINISTSEYDIGGIAIDKHGTALPQNTLVNCENSDAILFGAVGGPKWEHLPPNKQPERASLLKIRKHFNLFANLRPIKLKKEMYTLSPLHKKISSKGFDIICIRELTGGIYFGKPKGTTKSKKNEYAFDTEIYYNFEIERIAHIAFKLANKRSKKIISVDKANVLESSVLWRKTVNRIATMYPNIKLYHYYIDNIIMQLIQHPYKFDIILCSNLFGDIISEECAALSGSIGMLPSASLNEKNFGLYEPAGGSAPNIAGKNIANPIAQILSLALLFRHSLKLEKIAKAIENAVNTAIKNKYYTEDITNHKTKPISTDEMGNIISDFIINKE